MPETNELMKRPKISDDLVKRRAFEMFMPLVKEYLGNDWSDSEQPHIEKQLAKVMNEYDDGYAMARKLERDHGWEEDRELVDLMDEGDSCLHKAHKELQAQWIQVYGITPERQIGDSVTTNIYDRKDQVGFITKFYLDEAKYGVRYPDQPMTSCYIVEYENVKDAA